jgi:hypothetical protein
MNLSPLRGFLPATHCKMIVGQASRLPGRRTENQKSKNSGGGQVEDKFEIRNSKSEIPVMGVLHS